MQKCDFCGRFMGRLDARTTGFPPGTTIASTSPYAPFVCVSRWSKSHESKGIPVLILQYRQVGFEMPSLEYAA